MFSTLLANSKLMLVNGAAAAGVTTVTPSIGVNMSGYGGCLFLFGLGAIVAGAVTSAKVQQSDDDGAGDSYGDLAGTGVTIADSGDNKLYAIDVKNPQKTWLKPILVRGTQNATLDGIWAILYEPKNAPVTQDSAHVGGSETHVSPAEGTA